MKPCNAIILADTLQQFNLETAELPSQLTDVFRQQHIDRDDVQDFVKALSEYEGNLGADPFPLKMDLSEGFFRREIKIPAGAVMAGALHRKDSYVIMLKGKCIVATEDGMKVVTGPCTFTSPRGKQKIGYCLEETIWLDIHECEAETVEEAEAEIFTADYTQIDSDDYALVLEELGMTEHDVRAEVEIETDIISIPRAEMSGVVLKDSEIHDMGLFAHKDFKVGDDVVTMRMAFDRTVAGRYVNHSVHHNTLPTVSGDDIYLVAVRDIKPGDEITINYRTAIECARLLDSQLSEG